MRIRHKTLLAAIAAGVCFTFVFGAATKSYAESSQGKIADQVMRFHVLANSDSDEDQELKIMVRDGVLDEFRQGLEASASLAATREYLTESLSAIEEYAEKILRDNGSDYTVACAISQDFFPTRVYGDISIPSGRYETLRIEIGDAAGRNWWCVMFPPLCYVDVAKAEVIPEEQKAELKELLSENEYLLLSESSDGGDVTVRIRFKIVEWWQNRLHKDEEKAEIVMVKNE